MIPLLAPAPLIDRFGRVHTNLRVSVTDRCNIRCAYCMPATGVKFLPRNEILSFEEITRFVRIVSAHGVRRVRLTGGEPLVRHNLAELVSQLAALSDVEEIALTTNGMLLAGQAEALKAAGLDRLNISLDTLREAKFEQISRRTGLDQVLAGIAAAEAAGFEGTRLNATSLRGFTEDEIIPLAEFALEHGLELRFIEYMPLDAGHTWSHEQVLTGREVLRRLTERFGELVPVEREDTSQPAVDYIVEGGGRIGFINSVSEPFCGDCNRLRLTAEGQVRNCLFSTTEYDARALLRSGASDEEIAQLVADAVAAKLPGHAINDESFLRPERAMYQIGG